jgi:transposase
VAQVSRPQVFLRGEQIPHSIGLPPPPYSPELNPIERVWRVARRTVTHNRYFLSIEELRSALISQFAIWNQPNNILKVLCANI